jgi:16S rRNA (guanine527-N7)-methyltransferase
MVHDYASIVPRETNERIDVFVKLLAQWNPKINLVAGSDPQEWMERHIYDSLQLLSHMESAAICHAADLGTGGGFPGLILAMATDIPWFLVESDKRKAAFLQKVAAELQLSHVKVVNSRIEECDVSVDLVTSRALAPLAKLLGYANNLLTKDGFCLFLKGENYAKELEEANRNWQFTYQSEPSISNAESRIIKIMQPLSKRISQS